YRKRNFSFLKEHGIPGPEPSLLFGNMLELVTKTPLKCLDEWFQKYGKIVGENSLMQMSHFYKRTYGERNERQVKGFAMRVRQRNSRTPDAAEHYVAVNIFFLQEYQTGPPVQSS
ncbi:hypothetical protein AVEN_19337-1, partial [Araneus ventricosus]